MRDDDMLLSALENSQYRLHYRIEKVSKNGTRRYVSFFVGIRSGMILNVTPIIGRIMKKKLYKDELLTFNGCNFSVGDYVANYLEWEFAHYVECVAL